MKISRKNLKRKLILRISIFVGLTLILMSGVMIYLLSSNLTKQLENNLRLLSGNSLKVLENRLAYLFENSENFATNPFIINALIDPSGRNLYLPNMSKNYTSMENIEFVTIVDFEGNSIYSTSPKTESYSDLFDLRESLVSGKPVIELLAATGTFIIIHPIKYYNTSQGAIITGYDMAEIAENIFDFKGDIFYQLFLDDHLIHQKNYSEDNDYISIRKEPGSAFTILTQMKVELVLGETRSSQLAQIKKSLYALFGGCFFFIIFSIILAVWIGGEISKPILLLCEKIKNSSEQTFNSCSPVGTNDELEELALAFDSQARKVFERSLELRMEKDYAEAIVYSMGDSLIVSDAQGYILTVNAATTMLLGCGKDELIGKRYESVFVEKVKEKGSFKNVERTFLTKEGKEIPILLSGSVLHDYSQDLNSTKAMGLVLVAKDIRERKIMDTKLRHSQKMESVGELAAGIAHEINTPIQFIGDNIQFLQNSYEDLGNILSDGDKLLEALRKGSAYKKLLDKLETSIRDSDLVFLREETPLAITQAQEGVRRVAKIVQAMKQFVHPGQEEKKFININEAIETVITVSKNEWKYIANMETNFDLGLPLVPCFANEFNQAILNIVVNAAHAIKAKIKKGYNKMGIITISTRSDADRVEVRIKDTGTGIPRNVQPRVFDPFFTTKEVGVGTGQGLHLVHGFIVIHHKGSLSFETETGEGTTFVIHLPLNAD